MHSKPDYKSRQLLHEHTKPVPCEDFPSRRYTDVQSPQARRPKTRAFGSLENLWTGCSGGRKQQHISNDSHVLFRPRTVVPHVPPTVCFPGSRVAPERDRPGRRSRHVSPFFGLVLSISRATDSFAVCLSTRNLWHPIDDQRTLFPRRS